ncbi:ATP-binding protein [Streptomyces sp. NBC_01216]|uniref:ATP-binding protein n=1 Tax=unclassified Streptomyces TaxID=2593676 RepID=UPI002E145804|nr:ATP-binding protein [Streptomyces sp. NBC_01216]
MDPMNRGPEDFGHDNEDDETRDHRGGLLPERVPSTPARARITRLVSGDLLLTVNPVDGSEIEACPPGEQPEPPRRRTAEERAETARTATPPVPPGPAAVPHPLLERQDPRDTLVRLLSQGRSVRLTGPSGSGRTTLLDTVAADCAGLAPDGVVRLSGLNRTPTELLYELFAVVEHAPDQRPDRTALLAGVAGIGAVVVVDDLEFGGTTLDELLTAAPECAFLFGATPEVPGASPGAHVEEVGLAGLGRAAALELLESVVGRPLTEDEGNWAGDLWFESEGLPLRFVQAGALLRQRDRLRVTPAEFDAFGALDEAFGPGAGLSAGDAADAGDSGDDEPADAVDESDVELLDIPLPTLGEGAAPAALLASRLSRSAQDTLRFAVALGGEVPHQAHLPALVGDTHADAALGELMDCGLLSPAGGRYRLAAGVLTQLLAQGYGEDTAERAHTVAQHYAWWAGHPSVTPARAVAEADALIAALTALVPGTDPEHPATAVLLARSAAPAFAAGLYWGAWERTLRSGQEAARLAGEVAEEAYFHHELGVLALCGGNLERARAELEASVGMRGVLADKRGTVAGRRALALVADRVAGRVPTDTEAPTARLGGPVSPPRGTPSVAIAALPPGPSAAVTKPVRPFPDFADGPTLVTGPDRAGEGDGKPRPAGLRGVVAGARRNIVAVGTGALLAAVLGTVVIIGATSGNADDPGTGRVTSDSTADETGDDGLDIDEPAADDPEDEPTGSASPSVSASASTGPTGTAATPSSPATSTSPSSPTKGTPGTTPSSPGPTTKPPTSPSSSPSASPSTSPSPSSPSPSPSATTTSPSPSGSTEGDNPGNSASATLSGGPPESTAPSDGGAPA